MQWSKQEFLPDGKLFRQISGKPFMREMFHSTSGAEIIESG
jgi:hypothetical protein